MKYEVLTYFTDLQDGGYPYNVGDSFPRSGRDVTDQRIAELSGNKNKRGIPLIKAVEVPEEPKPSKVVKDGQSDDIDIPKKQSRTKKQPKG